MLSAPQRRVGTRRSAAGLSVVELMVGIAIGLLVVAAATMLMGSQLGENRRMLLELQLQQDLRAAGDIISREARRIGSLSSRSAGSMASTLWTPGGGDTKSNTLARTLSVGSAEFTAEYQTDENPSNVWAAPGYRLQSDGVLYTRVGTHQDNSWQPLTDPASMKVTDFAVSVDTSASEVLPCPKLCPDSTTACWPRVQVRQLAFRIEAEARRDATVKRSISGSVRLRNDLVTFTDNAADRVCPA